MLKIGIDASRNRSGGAIAHLYGILNFLNPSSFGISEIHIWSYQRLLDTIPDYPWLKKHSPTALNRSLFMQLFWQRFKFPDEFKAAKCNILLNTDAATISRIRPCVTMSRDMLSYEPGIINLYGLSTSRLRILVLRFVQNRSLRFSDGVIFLTEYASYIIQKSCGQLKSVALIPHGVGDAFRLVKFSIPWPANNNQSIRCIYVSNAELYKNQWQVIKAVSLLRNKGFNIKLTLIGGGEGVAQKLLCDAIYLEDPLGQFIDQKDFLPQNELPFYIANSHIFIFASSCENMPNTLLEAMATGIPIACSSRGPMPEILQEGGVYFIPEDPESILNAVKKIIENKFLRKHISQIALERSRLYSWERCARETWQFLAEINFKQSQRANNKVN
jgi:glycosyltransferase involved in cell wall biosynthesis